MCAWTWRRLANDHIFLHVRASGESPESTDCTGALREMYRRIVSGRIVAISVVFCVGGWAEVNGRPQPLLFSHKICPYPRKPQRLNQPSTTKHTTQHTHTHARNATECIFLDEVAPDTAFKPHHPDSATSFWVTCWFCAEHRRRSAELAPREHAKRPVSLLQQFVGGLLGKAAQGKALRGASPTLSFKRASNHDAC